MVELKEKVVHSTTYDIDIQQYLTYAQIQQIVNAVEKAAQTDGSWATRETNIDMLVLYHATNLDKEKLEEIGHETLLQSGLIDNVKTQIVNYHQLKEALDFTESLPRAAYKLISQMPKVLDNDVFKAAMKKYGK